MAIVPRVGIYRERERLGSEGKILVCGYYKQAKTLETEPTKRGVTVFDDDSFCISSVSFLFNKAPYIS